MPGDKWDGKISNLNISDQAFPELHAELSKMHHKARSDRLRSLALLLSCSLGSVFSSIFWQNDDSRVVYVSCITCTSTCDA